MLISVRFRGRNISRTTSLGIAGAFGATIVYPIDLGEFMFSCAKVNLLLTLLYCDVVKVRGMCTSG